MFLALHTLLFYLYFQQLVQLSMQLIKQSKLCNLKVAEATSWPSLRSHCSHLLERPTSWPGERPPDDGWCAAGNERLYQAALSSTSRSRQARFLSNCIGFSNFLFQDEWMEILRGEGVGVIVYNPGVIITYDPFSISGLSQHMLVITLGPPIWERCLTLCSVARERISKKWQHLVKCAD